MKKYRLYTTPCSLLPAPCSLFPVTCFLLSAFCFLLSAAFMSEMVFAQATEPEASAESLQLPLVVITGIDRSKVQRMLPKVNPRSDVPVIAESARDRSDAMVWEGELARNRQLLQAETQYVKAIKLDSRNSRAYLRLGDIYRAQNKYVEAATAYQDALHIQQNLPEAHYRLGLLYESHLQDLPKAIEHFQAYLQLGGSDRRVQIWLRDAARPVEGNDDSS
jgi:tetratricopeptide (TPR) repeat protein